MSRTMNKKMARRYRGLLLTTVCTAALLISAYDADRADAAGSDADRPPLWIDFGWHFEDMRGLGDPFRPPFDQAVRDNGFKPPSETERLLAYGYGGESSISFEPGDSGWIFSASVRYGRSHSRKQTHEQHYLPPFKETTAQGNPIYLTKIGPVYADTRASNSETHGIIDFQVGKDVGLGIFGHAGTSSLNFGLRFGQFNSKSSSDIEALPSIKLQPRDIPPFKYNVPLKYSHNYVAHSRADRSFHGMGPSISWNGSAPVLGDVENGELVFDFGLNAAMLIGRQKTTFQRQTSGDYYYNKYPYHVHYKNTVGPLTRERSVVVPNAGGFAGASYRIEDFKVSMGYRADFFFGAIDGGWDTRKSTTRGFYGPFASISIGIGD